MVQSANGRLPVTGHAWKTYTARSVTVHALAGSYASRSAAAELREAERAVETLEKMLDLPRGSAARDGLEIYLMDPALGTAGTGSREPESTEVVVRILQPEEPGEPVTWAVTRLVVGRLGSSAVASAPFFIDGLAGVVAARTGSGVSVKVADEAVRADLQTGKSVSVFPRMSGSSQSWGDRVAASFVGYLMDNAGGAALRKFLEEYDPERRDQAAVSAFGRPLGALEEGWLQHLKRRAGGRSAFPLFLRKLWPLIRPYWLQQAELFFYLFVGLAYGIAMPLASKYLIDTIIPSGDVSNLVVFVVVLFAIYFANSVMGMRRSWLNSWVNSRILLDLQEKMFAHLQRLGHSFYGQAKVGDIMTRMSSDLGIVQGAMMAILNSGIFSTLSALAGGIVLFLLSPLLTLLVVVVVPIFTFCYLALRSRLQKASYERQRLAGETSSALQENLSAHAVIKAFGLEEQAIHSYHGRLDALLKSSLRLVLVSSLFSTSTDLAITLGQVLVLGVGGYLVMSGSLTIGTLFAFMGLLPSLFGPVAALSGLGQTVETATGSLDRVEELINEPVRIEDSPGAAALPPLSRGIHFEEVCFGYSPDRPVLQDLTLSIPAGSHVAIVGPSGSGKSTFANMVMRFWDPDSGRVLLDGHDAREVTVSSLRGQIGLVFQDTFIFDTTVRENIGIGKLGATDAEIASAARAARLDDSIASLPAGYDTVLGERGVRMSGGQRQRLAIARTVLRDPRILVLDEATSALDAQTEREILETLEELARGRTTISITHRLALAARTDRIFVLEGGRLIQEGSHTELVAVDGLYRRLYEEQTGYVSGGPRLRAGVDAEHLRGIPLFAGLRGDGLVSLANRLMLERYAAGEDVVRQGDEADRLYIISRGRVEVLVSDHGTERQVNTLTGGDYFGEMALLAGGTRTATVRTAEPTELYVLSRTDFDDLVQNEPAVRAALEASLALRYAALREAVSAASVGPVATVQ